MKLSHIAVMAGMSLLLVGCGYNGVASSKDVTSSISMSQPDSGLAISKYLNTIMQSTSSLDAMLTEMIQPQVTPTASQYDALSEQTQNVITDTSLNIEYIDGQNVASVLQTKKELALSDAKNFKSVLQDIVVACRNRDKNALTQAYGNYQTMISAMQSDSSTLNN